MKDYQDWEYCSVHMFVQRNDASTSDVTESSITEQLKVLNNTDGDNSTEPFARETHVDFWKDSVEVTSIGDLNIDDELDLIENDSYSATQDFSNTAQQETYRVVEVSSKEAFKNDTFQTHYHNVDIDVFFPSLLLSFESLLNQVFNDLKNGLQHHNLYSMGLAQYLKLEDEQIDGNAVKLRYRLPIDNLKYVLEAM